MIGDAAYDFGALGVFTSVGTPACSALTSRFYAGTFGH